MPVKLSHDPDGFQGKFNASKSFHGKIHVSYTMNDGCIFYNDFILKLKASLKIKIYFWFFPRGVFLTKENLAKRRRNEKK